MQGAAGSDERPRDHAEHLSGCHPALGVQVDEL